MLTSRSAPAAKLGARALGTVSALMALAVAFPGAGAAPSAQLRASTVVDVPSRPAFVTLPGRSETAAAAGQRLAPQTVLRTERPGRLQVQLPDGRSFRLGGNALLRLAGNTLDLQRGQIIAWVNPGTKGGAPLRVKTRVGTASIVGTTVFIDATDEAVTVFSWEGTVRVDTDSGQQVVLSSGEQFAFEQERWQPPRRLSRSELDTRRARSILLNGFNAPMETLPVIEKELGFRP